MKPNEKLLQEKEVNVENKNKAVDKNDYTVEEGRTKLKGILKPWKAVDLSAPRQTRSGKIVSPATTKDIQVMEKTVEVPKQNKYVTFRPFHDDSSTDSEFDIPEETMETKPPKGKKPQRVLKCSMPAADSESDSIIEPEGTPPPKEPKLK